MYCIIYNPTAGAGRSLKVMHIVEQTLREKNVAFTVFETQYKEHAVSLARSAIGQGFDGIISVGGDGTLLEIAGAIHGSDEILGIIPAGTGNDFRVAVDVPKDPAQALEVILAGNRRRVDVGLLGEDRFFLNVAGTGFDVEVIKNTDKVRKRFTGGFAYFLGIFLSIFGYKSINIKLTVDGKSFKRSILLIAIANGKCYAGGLNVAPDSKPDDGLFNIVLLNRMPNWRILFELPKMKKGHPEMIPGCEKFSCRELIIDSDRPLRFNLDGEVYGNTPVRISVIPKALSVFCP
jgi:YegS/Rv2252/BmrU family lipid kinase